MDVRMFTVGPVAENTYIFRRDGSDKALIVDPGEEAPKLLGAIEQLGVELEGILLTHTHFDHVGRWRRWPGDRRRGVGAGDREAGARRHHELRAVGGLRALRELGRRAHRRRRRAARARGLRDRRDLHPRPQPRPRDLLDPGRAGHLLRRRAVRAVRRPHRPARRRLAHAARVDPRPGGRAARETTVYPGHMGVTSLGAERAHQPVPGRARTDEGTAAAPGVRLRGRQR